MTNTILESKTPTLRFPEFSGEWDNKSLAEYIERLDSGVSVNSIDKQYSDNEIGILKTSSVFNGKFNPNENKTIVPEEENRARLNPTKDSIIVSRMNTPQLVGEIGYVDMDYPNLFIPDRLWITKTNKNINVRWLSFALTTPKSKFEISNLGTGTSGSMKNISKPNFLGLKIKITSLPEQQKIAQFLTAVDSKLQQLTKKKQLLEQYKKGVMQQIFSQKLRFKISNKDGELVEPPDWEEKKLGEIATFSKGRGISKADISEIGNVNCIRYGELYTLYGEIIKETFSKTNINKNDLVLSESNDVIIPASGETQIGIAKASCVIKKGIALGGDLNIIKSKCNGVYLSYYLNSAKKIEIARLSQGISVVHLYSSQLKQLKINYPCLEEQTQIANFLSAIDTKIDLVNTQLEKTQEFKKGLLQQMFV